MGAPPSLLSSSFDMSLVEFNSHLDSCYGQLLRLVVSYFAKKAPGYFHWEMVFQAHNQDSHCYWSLWTEWGEKEMKCDIHVSGYKYILICTDACMHTFVISQLCKDDGLMNTLTVHIQGDGFCLTSSVLRICLLLHPGCPGHRNEPALAHAQELLSVPTHAHTAAVLRSTQYL